MRMHHDLDSASINLSIVNNGCEHFADDFIRQSVHGLQYTEDTMRVLFATVVLALLVLPASIFSQVFQTFLWDSHIVQRIAPSLPPNDLLHIDSNRFDITIPSVYSDSTGTLLDVTIRGAGQILVPRYFFPFYDGYYNGQEADYSARDQDYIDQLKGVQQWQLDSISLLLFHNPNNSTPLFSGTLDFYRLNIDHRDREIIEKGLTFQRNDINTNNLIADTHITLDPEALSQTTTSYGSINRTVVRFNPPLEFSRDEAILLLYSNNNAPPVQGISSNVSDTSEWQRIVGYMEYRNGIGSDSLPYTNPLPKYMVHGVVLLNEKGNEVIRSTYSSQLPTHSPLHLNLGVLWYGKVVLDSNDVPQLSWTLSVNRNADVGSALIEGLETIRPNPVRSSATIPFTLAANGSVTIALYSSDGRVIETLMQEAHYEAGRYTLHLDTQQIESGAYVVHLSVNGKMYTRNLIVLD